MKEISSPEENDSCGVLNLWQYAPLRFLPFPSPALHTGPTCKPQGISQEGAGKLLTANFEATV